MEYLLYFFFFLSILFPIIHSIHCFRSFKKRDDHTGTEDLEYEEKGLSILIPCYNEQRILDTSINSIKELSYSNLEVIYINDGSNDTTLNYFDFLLQLRPSAKKPLKKLSHEKVKKCYQSELYPNVFVIDKENGGKADALNAGIEYSSKPLVITLDADTIVTDKALTAVNRKFHDENVVAAGGVVHVLQTKVEEPMHGLSLRKAKMLVRAQALDFLRAFYINKISLAGFNALGVISGAFGIFTKKALVDVGGYRTTIGEDIDITLKMHKYIEKDKKRKVALIPDAVGFTELPETWVDLFKQRVRWQKAFIDCFIHYGPFLFKTFFKKPVSFFYIVEGFVSGTLAVYVMTGAILIDFFHGHFFSLTFLIYYVVYIFLLGYVYDELAIEMSEKHGFFFQEKEDVILAFVIFFDIFIYRFIIMTAIIYGTVAYFINNKNWNKVQRTGRDYTESTEHAA